MRSLIGAGILMLGVAAGWPVYAQGAGDEVAQLKQRVAQLERQVEELAQLVGPLKAQRTVDTRRRELRLKFEKRMAQDRERYNPDQMRDAENLMRIADQQWSSPEGRASLETLIKKYPDSNRAGCATLYVAQQSQGDRRATVLQSCIEKYNDCMYGDGVQVGAYARFLLALDYKQKGQPEKAETLFGDLKTKYSAAIDHGGRMLDDSSKAD